jgi:hypothetical protein
MPFCARTGKSYLTGFEVETAAFLALPQEESISKLAASMGMIFFSVI